MQAKFAVKTRNGRIMYKCIYNQLFLKNALGNRDAACETTIGYLEYHCEKKIFNWEKYTNLHVEHHTIKATMTAHGFNDWSEAHKV